MASPSPFKLRPGLKFSNGDPVTAQAVKDSFAFQLSVPAASFRLKNIARLNEASQMVVKDESTIVL